MIDGIKTFAAIKHGNEDNFPSIHCKESIVRNGQQGSLCGVIPAIGVLRWRKQVIAAEVRVQLLLHNTLSHLRQQ